MQIDFHLFGNLDDFRLGTWQNLPQFPRCIAILPKQVQLLIVA